VTALARAKNGRTAAMAALLVAGDGRPRLRQRAALPLFCQVTGFGGTPCAPTRARPARGARRQEIGVRFDANINSALPWEFEPESKRRAVAIGARDMAFYTAPRTSRAAVTGTATFNVTPARPAIFHQDPVLLLHRADAEARRGACDMPVIFFVDPKILDDPDDRAHRRDHLSYTFYPVETPARSRARARGKGQQGRAADRWPEPRTTNITSCPEHLAVHRRFSALALTGGGVMWMHGNPYGKFVFGAGLLGVLFVMFSWWVDIREAHAGDHTPVVQLHLRYGMILFIASEVMFFVAWFWAYFNAALFPVRGRDPIGGTWPPKGIEVLDPFGFPLLNT
jgi:cytochrome c oxidase assembly protein Cox11